MDGQSEDKDRKLKRELLKAEKQAVIAGLIASSMFVGMLFAIVQNVTLKKQLSKTQSRMDSLQMELNKSNGSKLNP
ncbi:hypothetical protein WSM22_17630 [Cytophagales bacterium WSM2-2]|nr:hypothetical protein WSM22_17630 [Cytophagales bacterium WSM2-2]